MTKPSSREIQAHHEAQAPVSNSNLLEVIYRAASDPSVDINKMRALLEMRQHLERDEAKRQFSAAMNAVQTELGPIAADAENSQTHSKYASYYALDKVLRPIYTKHGFEVSYDTEDSPKGHDHVRVVMTVSHTGGAARQHKHDVPADGKGAKGNDVMTKTHASVAAVKYGKRVCLGMGFNISVGGDPADDDGNFSLEYISEEQVDELRALIKEVGADEKKFLEFGGVKKLEAILAKDFDHAKALLEAKRKAQK